MEFTSLTQDEQNQIIDGHLKQAEADYLHNILNYKKMVASAEGEDDPDTKLALETQAQTFHDQVLRCQCNINTLRTIKDNPSLLDE